MIRAYGMKRLREMQAKSKKPADPEKEKAGDQQKPTGDAQPTTGATGEQKVAEGAAPAQTAACPPDAQTAKPSEPVAKSDNEGPTAGEKDAPHRYSIALPGTGPSASTTCDSIATQVTLVAAEADEEKRTKIELEPRVDERQAAAVETRAPSIESALSERQNSPASSSTDYMPSVDRRSEVRPILPLHNSSISVSVSMLETKATHYCRPVVCT